MRSITYAIYTGDDGVFVVSRVGNDIAWPVLDFKGIGLGGLERTTGRMFRKGNFHGPTNYDLERFPVHSISAEWKQLRWTKKVPLKTKNAHRRFWGMRLLKPAQMTPEQRRLRRRLRVPLDRTVFDLLHGLRGHPRFCRSAEIAGYLGLPVTAITTSRKAIRAQEVPHGR